MRVRLALAALAVASISLWLVGREAVGPRPALAADVAAHAAAADAVAAAAPDACSFPSQVEGSPAETAWRIFVAANCFTGPRTAQIIRQLAWERWSEQLEVYPASGKPGLPGAKPKRLHGSPLFLALAAKGAAATELNPGECNTMQAPPSNVVPGARVCEEVRLNPPAKQLVESRSFEVRSGQVTAAKDGQTVVFPEDAIEIKVDWIPATDFPKDKQFSCAKPPEGVHVAIIDGVCYAMAGMNIMSKLMPNWIWATFEPQSNLTNPNRCMTFGPCNDPWGSDPPTSSGGPGGFTKQTQKLADLMKRAKLAPEFYNYRLDGVQTEFGTRKNPTLLGNSIVEGENAGLKAGEASCITCHSVSTVNKDGTDGIRNISKPPQVGPEYVPPAGGWMARDFVWSMAEACPCGLQSCKPKGPPCGTAEKAKKTSH